MYRCDDDKAVSHTSTAVEVDLPIGDCFNFLSDIQNASVWHPHVRGAIKWVRAKPCAEKCRDCDFGAHAWRLQHVRRPYHPCVALTRL